MSRWFFCLIGLFLISNIAQAALKIDKADENGKIQVTSGLSIRLGVVDDQTPNVLKPDFKFSLKNETDSVNLKFTSGFLFPIKTGGPYKIQATNGIETVEADVYVKAGAVYRLKVKPNQELSGIAGSRLEDGLSVLAVDRNDNPVSNVSIDWDVVSGNMILDQSEEKTNDNGFAKTGTILGGFVGIQTLKANIHGNSNSELLINVTSKLSPLSPQKLMFSTVLSKMEQGKTFLPDTKVSIRNVSNNILTEGSYPVTLKVYTDTGCLNESSVQLTGITVRNSAMGEASFPGLSYSGSGTIFLGAQSGTLKVCSNPIEIVEKKGGDDQTKKHLSIVLTSNTAARSQLISPINVEVRDSKDALFRGESVLISISAHKDNLCQQPISQPLSGIVSVLSSGGIARFVTVKSNYVGNVYFKAEATGFSSICSEPIAITNPGLAKVIFYGQPKTSAIENKNFGPIYAKFLKQNNLPVQISDVSASIGAFSDPQCLIPATGILSGNTTAVSVATGLVTFDEFKYSKPETVYIGLSSFGLEGACSSAVVVKSAEPVEVLASIKKSSSVQESIVDSPWGAVSFNLLNDKLQPYKTRVSVEVKLYSNDSCSMENSALNGSKSVMSNNGQVSFSDLWSSEVGSFFYQARVGSIKSECIPISITCPIGMHNESSECVSNSKQCLVTNGQGVMTWLNTEWGSCVATACDDGATMVNGECIVGQQKATITVTREGIGFGAVKNELTGQTCGLPVCEFEADVGEELKLVPIADLGSKFYGFGGSCSGTMEFCAFLAQDDSDVTVAFGTAPHLIKDLNPGIKDGIKSNLKSIFPLMSKNGIPEDFGIYAGGWDVSLDNLFFLGMSGDNPTPMVANIKNGTESFTSLPSKMIVNPFSMSGKFYYIQQRMGIEGYLVKYDPSLPTVQPETLCEGLPTDSNPCKVSDWSYYGQSSHTSAYNFVPTTSGKIFTTRMTDQDGVEVWQTDGTKAGSKIAFDITPGYKLVFEEWEGQCINPNTSLYPPYWSSCDEQIYEKDWCTACKGQWVGPVRSTLGNTTLYYNKKMNIVYFNGGEVPVQSETGDDWTIQHKDTKIIAFDPSKPAVGTGRMCSTFDNPCSITDGKANLANLFQRSTDSNDKFVSDLENIYFRDQSPTQMGGGWLDPNNFGRFSMWNKTLSTPIAIATANLFYGTQNPSHEIVVEKGRYSYISAGGIFNGEDILGILKLDRDASSITADEMGVQYCGHGSNPCLIKLSNRTDSSFIKDIFVSKEKVYIRTIETSQGSSTVSKLWTLSAQEDQAIPLFENLPYPLEFRVTQEGAFASTKTTSYMLTKDSSFVRIEDNFSPGLYMDGGYFAFGSIPGFERVGIELFGFEIFNQRNSTIDWCSLTPASPSCCASNPNFEGCESFDICQVLPDSNGCIKVACKNDWQSDACAHVCEITDANDEYCCAYNPQYPQCSPCSKYNYATSEEMQGEFPQEEIDRLDSACNQLCSANPGSPGCCDFRHTNITCSQYVCGGDKKSSYKCNDYASANPGAPETCLVRPAHYSCLPEGALVCEVDPSGPECNQFCTSHPGSADCCDYNPSHIKCNLSAPCAVDLWTYECVMQCSSNPGADDCVNWCWGDPSSIRCDNYMSLHPQSEACAVRPAHPSCLAPGVSPCSIDSNGPDCEWECSSVNPGGASCCDYKPDHYSCPQNDPTPCFTDAYQPSCETHCQNSPGAEDCFVWCWEDPTSSICEQACNSYPDGHPVCYELYIH